ncbi:Hsp90 co-chaperone Cdc37 [Dissostichus eleginoides]|uniref:Hsp90 co-chaperone Cdc37 n=1 Tax=Dissostichus eleginoides TaxID=100907 RepID=A0AAD9BNW3_DISEL|nr:Hsp90 co-chaperone Cdc37 [Dissostichus eleginoides]
MSTGTGIDYSAWDHVYVSDDEDVTSPHVDTQSLFRMRHRLKKVQAEVKKLKKDEKSFQKMIEEYRREEKKQPWDVDNISKDGFSKSVLNIKPVTKEETEKETVEKHKTFVEKYAKEIKHFGMLRRWDDSQKYLSDGPHLVCEETANCLVVICLDFQIDEKPALMEQVAHQAIVMQFILDLARTLKVDARGCFREFFSKIKTADKPYLDAFDQELDLLKDRIRRCARAQVENTVKELEEEERQMRLGPGGLDPLEVYESLPKEVQKGFDEKNIQLLQEAMSKLGLEDGKYHLRRCIDSGLWRGDRRGRRRERKRDEAQPILPLIFRRSRGIYTQEDTLTQIPGWIRTYRTWNSDIWTSYLPLLPMQNSDAD